MAIDWNNPRNINEKRYRCGYCGLEVGPSYGYDASKSSHKIYICPNCNKPSYYDPNTGKITPGVAYGEQINNIPYPPVKELHEEARRCMAENCFTAAVLCCRKLLMNVSVSLGAPKNKNFAEYVEFLDSNHYINPSAKSWVDIIRKKGNEATHEIPTISESDAQRIIKFSEMLLKTIFEYPALATEVEEQT